MMVVSRPISDYGHAMDEELQLRCHRCGKRFKTLTECWLCYEAPAAGARVEARWGHRKCVEGEGKLKLVRGDWALRRLIEALVTPPMTGQCRVCICH